MEFIYLYVDISIAISIDISIDIFLVGINFHKSGGWHGSVSQPSDGRTMITYAFAIAIRSLTEDTEVKHP